MAYDLVVKLTLQDDFSRKIEMAQRRIIEFESRLNQASKNVTNFSKQTSATGASVARLSSTFKSAGSQVATFGNSAKTVRSDVTAVGSSIYALDRALNKYTTDMNRSMTQMSNYSRVLTSLNRNLRNTQGHTSTTGSLFTVLNNSVGRGLSQITRFSAALIGVGSAYMAARSTINAAGNLFDLSVGSAASYEYTKVITGAMFGVDQQTKADAYLEGLRERSLESMFSMQQLTEGARNMIPSLRNEDLETVEKFTDIMERLAIYDPVQGTWGAGYSIRELLAGDIVSFYRRFELPRADLNAMKDLPPAQLADALDMLLNKMGISNEMIDNAMSTTYGRFQQAINRLKNSLLEVGLVALDEINPRLEQFNEFLKSSDFQTFVESAKVAFDDWSENFGTWVDELVDDFKTDFLENEKWTSLSPSEQIEKAFSEFGKALGKSILLGMLEVVGDGVSSVLGWAFGSVEDWKKSFSTDNWFGTKRLLTDIYDSAKELGGFFTGAPTTLSDVTKQSLNNLSESSGFSDLVNKTSSLSTQNALGSNVSGKTLQSPSSSGISTPVNTSLTNNTNTVNNNSVNVVVNADMSYKVNPYDIANNLSDIIERNLYLKK